MATVRVTEAGSLLLLPAAEFHRLSRKYSQFRYFFAPTGQERLSGAISAVEEGDQASANLLTTPKEVLFDPVKRSFYDRWLEGSIIRDQN